MRSDQQEGLSSNPLAWIDDRVKQWSSLVVDEKKRAAKLNAIRDLSFQKHQKVQSFAKDFFDEKKRIQQLSKIYEMSMKKQQIMDARVRQFADVLLDEKKRTAHLSAIHEFSLKNHQKMDRTMQFWTRTVAIYASYKATQVHVQFVSDEAEQERIWEERHEIAADKIYSLCSELGGFFLKSAQLLAKPDLSPMAWVKKLVVLCDGAPETPYLTVQKVLEQELGQPMDTIFERFDRKPLGSASVAQVHRARVRGADNDVAVKVQHPGAHELMMTDIRNQKVFAHYLQRFDVQFDLLSILEELEQQVEFEFDFVREANSMDRISESFQVAYRGKPPVFVPHSVPGLVTEKVLVMDFIEGTPILKLGDEMDKRGINPNGYIAKLAKRNILRDLTSAYGQMILRDGFFQADPHPGNILINKGGKVALLDYGQVKELSDDLRLGFAQFVVAMASNNIPEVGRCFQELGIETTKTAESDPTNFKTLASSMFDTRMPPGVTKVMPFGDDTVLNEISVKNFPRDLFFILRTIHILRGLSVAMECPYSSSEQWKPLAQEVLAAAGKPLIKDVPDIPSRSEKLRELVWEKRRRVRRQGRMQST